MSLRPEGTAGVWQPPPAVSPEKPSWSEYQREGHAAPHLFGLNGARLLALGLGAQGPRCPHWALLPREWGPPQPGLPMQRGDKAGQ